MTYSWAWYPFLNVWNVSGVVDASQTGLATMEYSGNDTFFNYGRTVQQDFPVTTIWYHKRRGNKLETLSDNKLETLSDTDTDSIHSIDNDDHKEDDQNDYNHGGDAHTDNQ